MFFARLAFILAATATAAFAHAAEAHTHQGLWWASPAGSENGWGINITHQGDMLFATWFTYDTDGSPMWLVMSNGMRQSDMYEGGYGYGGMMMFTNTDAGTLYRTTGPAFNAATFDPNAVTVSTVGTASFNFDDPNTGMFAYTVNGVMQSKAIVRQVFGSPMAQCGAGGVPAGAPNYQDLWWRSPAGSESGWGLNITHQGDTLFATWFTYGADGRGMWLVMSNGARTAPGVYSGALYRTRGPRFDALPWNGPALSVTEVGTGTLTFSDSSNGVFAYTVDGVTQSKPITRQVYAIPVSVCRFP
jgi:hypothetical protein